MSPEMIQAVANAIGAIAWPAVAIFAALSFRSDIVALLKRLRKGGPAEFDPPTPAIATVTESAGTLLAISKTASDALSALPATPATRQWEESLRNSDPLKSISSPAEREQILTRVAARALLTNAFANLDANIWASQLAALTYLNANRNGVSRDLIKTFFYDKAASAFPDAIARYPFENYFQYLVRSGLVTIDNNGTAQITVPAIEYLAWRVEQAKPPKTVG